MTTGGACGDDGAVSALAIDLHDVAKTYAGGVAALRAVTMQVGEGEIFGLLGPNGAGKSTLVKILLTIVQATRVSGTRLGQPIGHRPTLGRVGYLPEACRFPEYLTGAQVLDYVGGLHRVPRRVRRQRASELVQLVGLAGWEGRRLGIYSKGMKQRLGLAQALINDPSIVFLDEPTDGLDPVGRRDVADILRELRRRGITVFLNSHLLGEAERLCDRVAILARGEVVRHGRIEELTHEGAGYELRVDGVIPATADALQRLLAAMNGQADFDPVEACTRLTVPGGQAQLIQPLIDELRRAGLVIVSIVPRRQSLEEFFIGVVGAAAGRSGVGGGGGLGGN